MRRPWRADFRGLLVVAAGLLVASSGTAAAHEVGGSRFDAPIPLPFLFAGAGVTVALTAGWLALSTDPRVVEEPRRRLATIPGPLAGAVELVGRVAFLLLFLIALALGLLGPRVAAENVATVFVWPVWLKGLAVVAAIVGSPWRVLSPWRTLYRCLAYLEGDEIALVGAYPSWLGEWPALVGFVAWIGVVENLTAVPRSPRATTVLVAGYSIVMLLGAVAYGEDWFDRADALAVLYRLFGRVAPFDAERTSAGGYSVSLRPPWAGCGRPVRNLVVVGFVVATVYTVSFDGFTGTPEYQAVLFATRDATGLGPAAGIPLYLAGFSLFCASFAAVVALADVAGGGDDRRRALLAFAPTVLPIAVAYEVAHNYPFVARNLGQLVTVLGRYVVAEPASVEPLAWLSLPAFWASQVVLVVAGHVVAVVAAHHVTVDRYPTRGLASRAHLPLTALMVGYTVLSLWIVSRPVVG